jgi:hypothetical protein
MPWGSRSGHKWQLATHRSCYRNRCRARVFAVAVYAKGPAVQAVNAAARARPAERVNVPWPRTEALARCRGRLRPPLGVLSSGSALRTHRPLANRLTAEAAATPGRSDGAANLHRLFFVCTR